MGSRLCCWCNKRLHRVVMYRSWYDVLAARNDTSSLSSVAGQLEDQTDSKHQDKFEVHIVTVVVVVFELDVCLGFDYECNRTFSRWWFDVRAGWGRIQQSDWVAKQLNTACIPLELSLRLALVLFSRSLCIKSYQTVTLWTPCLHTFRIKVSPWPHFDFERPWMILNIHSTLWRLCVNFYLRVLALILCALQIFVLSQQSSIELLWRSPFKSVGTSNFRGAAPKTIGG